MPRRKGGPGSGRAPVLGTDGVWGPDWLGWALEAGGPTRTHSTRMKSCRCCSTPTSLQ